MNGTELARMRTETKHIGTTETADLPPLRLDQRSVTSSDAGQEHLPFVDGLRVLALLALALSYVGALAPNAFGGAGSTWARAFAAGSHGVEIFFALSSFCLTYPILLVLRCEHAVGFDGARFVAKRIARVVLPYYAALAILVLLPSIAARIGHPFALGEPYEPVDLLKQVLFLDHGTKFVNPALWTLCLQVRWYALFPFALSLWVKSPRAFGVIAIGTVAVSLFTETRSLDLAYLPAFMLGIVAAHFYLQPVRFQRFTIVVAAAFVAASFWIESVNPGLNSATVTIPPGFTFTTSIFWQISALLVILGVAEIRFLDRLFGAPEFKWIAGTAFSIFLVGEPVLVACTRALHGHLIQPVVLAIGVAAALGASLAFWLVVERTFEGVGIRSRIVAGLTPAFRGALKSAGVPSLVVLEDTPLETEAVEVVPSAPRRAAASARLLRPSPSEMQSERLEAARKKREEIERRAAERRERERAKLEERERRAAEEAERKAEIERARREREEEKRLAAEEAAREAARVAAEQAALIAAEAAARAAAEEANRQAVARAAAEEAERIRLEAERERLEAERERARTAREEREQAELAQARERARLKREEIEAKLAEARQREDRERAERAAAVEAERARIESERREAERARLEAERLEAERIAAEARAESERARLEAERLETERVRLEAERARFEAERIAAEAARAEAERREAERIATEAARRESERVRLEAERARFEAERIAAETARAEAEQREAERVAAEAARAAAQRREAERLAAETAQAEAERAAREAERIANEAARREAERVRLEAERARFEAERIAAENARAEAERVAAEAARAEAQRRETERLAAEAARAEAARVEAARIEAERIEAARIEAERAEAARIEAERVAAERAETARIEAERKAAEAAEERSRREREAAQRKAAADAALKAAEAARSSSTKRTAEEIAARKAAEEAERRAGQERAQREREREELEAAEFERKAREKAERIAEAERRLSQQHAPPETPATAPPPTPKFELPKPDRQTISLSSWAQRVFGGKPKEPEPDPEPSFVLDRIARDFGSLPSEDEGAGDADVAIGRASVEASADAQNERDDALLEDHERQNAL